MLEARPYQTRTVDSIVARWRLSQCRIACVAPTGAGKTAIAALVILRYPEQRWCFLAHTRDLVLQAARALEASFPGEVGITMAGIAPTPFARVQVCSVQTLLARDYLPEGWLILDECFPGNTLVGGRRIDSILVGDTVDSVNHATGMVEPKKVTRIFKKRSSSMWRMRIGATVLHSTENHPVFVKGRGYVAAKNIVPGDLLCMWDFLHGDGSQRRAQAEDLLEGLYEQDALPDHGIHESGPRLQANDRAKPDAPGSRTGEAVSDAEANRSRAEDPWRQRARNDPATGGAAFGARGGVDSGASREDRIARSGLPVLLQDRHRARGAEDSDRGRRLESLHVEAASTGQEEGEILVWSRVDRSESLECASDGCDVYNLEVEDNHTYFANGVLVHNCHHYGAEEWQAFIERLGDRNCLALTATPERADGVGLRGLFQDITVAAHYSELIRDGYIVPARTLRPSKRLRGVAQDPVSAYLDKGEGRYGFTFCRTVEIARDTAAKYTAFGVPAACIDYESDDRQETIAGLGTRYQMLTSVYALTEGVDVPGASVCVLARGVGHQSALLQMGGRVLRSAPGKTDALFLDLPGVTWDLGLPHEDREYSLDGITRKPGSLSLRVCQQCGYTEPSGALVCGRCGFKLPPQDLRPQVHGVEIAEHAQHSDLEKTLRLSGLINEAKRKGYHDDWIQQRYRAEYGGVPEMPLDVERRMAMYEKLKDTARRGGYSVAYAAARFKSMYKCYPPRNW